MWEWRTYFEKDFKDDLPSFLNFDDKNAEERSDFYYDFGLEEYGLKERLPQDNKDTKPKLELKIRFDRTDEGIEYWHKVISHEYPNLQDTHLPMYQIDDILTEVAVMDEEFGSDIEYFQTRMTSKYEITNVKKRRWEIQAIYRSNQIEFEYVELEIANQKFFGLSIEAEDVEIIQTLIDRFNLDRFQFVGGYPSIVKTLNHVINHQEKMRKLLY